MYMLCASRPRTTRAAYTTWKLSLERLAAEDAAGEHAIEIEAGVLKLDMWKNAG